MRINNRERFVRTLTFGNPDRVYFNLGGFWASTVPKWHEEGLPSNVQDVGEYFGFDKDWRWGRIPMDAGPIPRLRVPRILEENRRYVVEMNGLGGIQRRLKSGYDTSEHLIDFPLKTREDWERIKERFDPHDPGRYPKYWGDELIEVYENSEDPVGLSVGCESARLGILSSSFGSGRHFGIGLFGWLRDLMGLQNLLVSFYRYPDWVHEMMDFFSDFYIELVRPAIERIKIDSAHIFEDMAYKTGPMISPSLFREFMLPRYKKVTAYLRDHGVGIISVDSDGDINPLVPLFLEGGVNVLHPLEVQGGMDALALRERYGKTLGVIGNIDKMALISGGERLRREVESKVPQLISQGGYIPAIDHSVPPDVPFKNYVECVNLVKRFIFA